MSNLIVLAPYNPSSITGNGDFPEAFETPDPKDVSVGVTSVVVGLGGSFPVDTVVVPYATASSGASISVSGLGSGSFLSPGAGDRKHALIHKADGPVSVSSVTVTFTGTVTAGVVCVGAAFKPTWDKEKGWGRRVIDTSVKRRLIGGGFGIGRGAKVAGLSWTFGDLTDTEREAMWALQLGVGQSDPICVVEDPDDTTGLGARIHYGLFSQLEPFERQNVDLNRWQLAVEGWG